MRFTDKNNAIHLLMDNVVAQARLATGAIGFREAARFLSHESTAGGYLPYRNEDCRKGKEDRSWKAGIFQ
jgi:hypothetical protein